MRLLPDTHALLWWFAGDTALSRKARDAIADESSEVHVSAVCAWEVATKHRLGRLPFAADLATDMHQRILDQGFVALAITLGHGQMSGALPGHHRDPFDRMLIARAMMEDMLLVSNERAFDVYPVKHLW